MATYNETLEALKESLIDYFGSQQNPVVQTVNSTAPASTGNMILFTYVINDIFEEVKKISAIRAKGIRDGNGKTMLDQYAITNDERSLFDSHCHDGVIDLLSIFSGYCKAIKPSFLYDVGKIIPQYDPAVEYLHDDLVYYEGNVYKSLIDSPVTSPTDILVWEPQPAYVDTKGKILIIMDYDPEYKDAVIRVIESRIKTAIIDYILAKWYYIVSLPDLYATYFAEYVSMKDNIRLNLFNLKLRERKFTEF